MNFPSDSRARVGDRWTAQPIFEPLGEVAAPYAPCGTVAARSDELEELYRLTEDAYGGAVPPAPAYPAPDLHFLDTPAGICM